MKKFTKVCLYIVLALFLVGLVVTIVASLLGGYRKAGELSDYIEERTDNHISLGGFWYHDGDNSISIDSNTFWSDDMITLNGSYEVSDLTNGEKVTGLKLSLGAISVKVKESTDNLYHLSVNANGDVGYYVDNGTLVISGCNGTNLTVNNNKMILYIPAEVEFDSIEIEMGAGELDADSLIVDKFELELGAGKVEIDKFSADECDLEVGAGECVFKEASVDKMNISLAAGNLRFDGDITKNCTIDCSMGNVDLNLLGDEKDFNYEIDCAAGNISMGGSSFAAIGGDRTINNDADKNMEISCALGNVKIDF